jgi:hypothetical protein
MVDVEKDRLHLCTNSAKTIGSGLVEEFNHQLQYSSPILEQNIVLLHRVYSNIVKSIYHRQQIFSEPRVNPEWLC